jgi:hypothetical protein
MNNPESEAAGHKLTLRFGAALRRDIFPTADVAGCFLSPFGLAGATPRAGHETV